MATQEEVRARHGILAVIDPLDTSTITELPPETVATGGDAAGVGTASAPAPMPRVAPHDALRNAVHNLDVGRWRSRECRTAVSASREAFGKALAAWNASGPAPITQAELMKQHIASNQAERVARAAAGQGVFYPGVGRTAKALAGGNARNGGGSSYRRGAYTRAEAMTLNNRAAAAARMNGSAAPRAKLPSER